MHLQLGDAGGHRVHSSLYSAARETNVRRGFFERSELSRITAALPVHMRGVAEFAFVTGWRTPSAILTLQWQVDFEAGEVRLDPGTTKNGDGRVFPMTTGLRRTLQQQRAVADQLERERGVTPRPSSVTGLDAARGTRSRPSRTSMNGGGRACVPAVRTGSRMIFGGPLSGISCAPACPSASRCI
jgi:hypothetical protein